MLKEKGKVYKPEEKKGFNFLKVLFLSYVLVFSIFLTNKILAQDAVSAPTSTPADLAKDIESPSAASPNKELDELEEKILHQKYPKDSKENRISRLEEIIFGRQAVNLTPDARLQKLLRAIPPSEDEIKPIVLDKAPQPEEPKLKPEELYKDPLENGNKPKVIYDEGFNQGVFGAVGQIETKVFNKTFNEVPFEKRVEKLEETILPKWELNQSRKKPLIERVSILVRKAGVSVPQQDPPIQLPPSNSPQAVSPQNNPPQENPNAQQSYTINPNTGFLVNEKTGEIAKDNLGNPIMVRIPQPLPQQFPQQAPPNYGYQFPGQQNQFPNTLPYGNQIQQGGFPGGQGGQFPYNQFLNPGNLDLGGEDEGY